MPPPARFMMYNEFGGEEGDDFDEEDFIGEYAIDDTLDPLPSPRPDPGTPPQPI